ncbi:hypothetical protein CC85DRAFT_151354 [Cutaneotrichosporon oleaginosum]|uniref:RCC1/BLIP-II protein n=1 Tax=Cutaneotrichosporon oleaginosum TaxID=879819 RepID=A0A0J0XH52_9TREE|nr:uncharacterized protein CC85DRAFT_151354 [Cutaneotrichosporon oleaginosum]KLT40421.1 hypothetical protein CC85DRAFT_151354 [Cutaneotrichosporon oleaginosum]TXT11386.1 hypothetical protein COLE_01796 [Cutaneotrichosporon oleaginosum]
MSRAVGPSYVWRRRLAKNPHCPPHLLASSPPLSSAPSPTRSPVAHSSLSTTLPHGLTPSRLYFGLKHPRVFSWGTHAKHLLEQDHAAESLFSQSVDVVCPVDVTTRFVSHPPLIALADVDTRLVATDAAGGLWEWDRARGMPGRPTRVWLTTPVAEVASGKGAYLVRDVDGGVWAFERQNVGRRRIAVPPATQIAFGDGVYAAMAALCGSDIWVWHENRVPIGVLDQERDDRIPSRMRRPPPRSAWLGWSRDGTVPRTNRALFEEQWAERGGEPSTSPASKRLASASSSTSEDSNSNCSEQGERVVRIACGWSDVLALKANGEVWLCDSLSTSWVFLPHFSRPDNYDIAMSFSRLAVFAASDPWPLFGTDFGGRGTNPHPPLALWQGAPPPARVVRIHVAGDHCVALGKDGKVYSWGEHLLARPMGFSEGCAERVWFSEPEKEEPFVIDVCGSAALALGDGCPRRRRRKGRETQAKEAVSAPPRRGLRARLLQMLW